MHVPALDLIDVIAYWCFRATLLIVFLFWLARHILHEWQILAVAFRQWRHEDQGE